MAKIHRLSLEAKIRAIDWLRANGPQLAQERPTYPDLGRQLSGVIGIPVASGTASELCKVAGVSWEARQRHARETVGALAVELRQQGALVADVCRELRALARTLGHATPLLDAHESQASS